MELVGRIVKIGNSRGVVLPSWWLKLEENTSRLEAVTLWIDRGKIIVKPRHMLKPLPPNEGMID